MHEWPCISPSRKLVIVAAPMCWLAACKGSSSEPKSNLAVRPALGFVAIKAGDSMNFRGTQFHLDEPRLAEKVKSVLTGAGIFAEFSGQSAKQPTANTTVEVRTFSEGSAEHPEIGVRLRLRIVVRPQGSAPARFNEDLLATGQVPLPPEDAGDPTAPFQRLAERTAEDLLLSYVARQRLWVANARDVKAALESHDTDLRVEALRIIGARKLREDVPGVLRLLADEDEAIRDAALGALVELRERTAVKALAESRPMRDVREMRKVLDAIATLGGQEAMDYLAFVAETHDDEDIRAMAKEALERLKRRPETSQTTR